MLRPGCVERCPGCRHRELSASESEAQKSRWLAQALGRWSTALRPLRAVTGERRWSYRDKACLRAEWDPDASRWKLGLRISLPGTRDTQVIAIPDCPVHSFRARKIIQELAERLPGGVEKLPLVFVLISGALVTLILKARDISDALRKELAELPWSEWGAEGAWINLNPAAGERVLSAKNWKLLWGKPQAAVKLGPYDMTYGPDSFQQLLPELYWESLEEAQRFLAPTPQDSVVDLCSGSGATLKLWRESGARALGVELGGEAVRCAEANAGPAACLRGKCSERLPQLQEWLASAQGRALGYANPPRLGMEPEVTRWLAREQRFEKLAYLSCSAGTLARDLALLEAEGRFRVATLIPYDFFPQTPHVETLALLERSR